MSLVSPLLKERLEYKPKLPKALLNIDSLFAAPSSQNTSSFDPVIKPLFPNTYNQPFLEIKKGEKKEHKPIKVGVVLSGGQAPGGHNVIWGLFEALKSLNDNNQLIGFLNGPGGIVANKSKVLSKEIIFSYRNTGGFDMIGSGRTKIETPEQFSAAEATVKAHDLDGLIIIGGDDSNTNAALLAEYFISRKVKTAVCGVPKTIDGDLKNRFIEVSFGFDTATKTYSEIIGNILTDMLSAKKYTFFIKLMGRSASHITLECALQTHPNLSFIGEEIAQKGYSLANIVTMISDMIIKRYELGKSYSAILIPEGLIEFIPEFKTMIGEINTLLGNGNSEKEQIFNKLTFQSKSCFSLLPEDIQSQLIFDRDPHGNVQVSKIETERLLISLVTEELKKRSFKGSYSPQPMFCGYEGRAGFPSNFDSQYCYALGYMSALLISEKRTGYICSFQNLSKKVEDWFPLALPISSMLHMEKRSGNLKPVIQKALVDINGKPYKEFVVKRSEWIEKDEFRNPGPIQFLGNVEVCDSVPLTLSLESSSE